MPAYRDKLTNPGFMFIVFSISAVALLVVGYLFPGKETLLYRIMDSVGSIIPIFVMLYFAAVGTKETILRSTIYSSVLSALFLFVYLSIIYGIKDMLWILIVLSLGVGIISGGFTAAIIYFNHREASKTSRKSRKISSEILISALIGAMYFAAVVGFYNIPTKTALLRGFLLAIFTLAMIQIGKVLRKTVFE